MPSTRAAAPKCALTRATTPLQETTNASQAMPSHSISTTVSAALLLQQSGSFGSVCSEMNTLLFLCLSNRVCSASGPVPLRLSNSVATQHR
jgi:hypothetical protein